MSAHLANRSAGSPSASFDRSLPVPLYYQLKEWLSRRILSGELAPGQRLAGELELSHELHVSRGVVRQALGELCQEGLLARERGRGTFVAAPKTAEGLISGASGLADDARLRGQRLESTVLVLRERPADPAAARSLELEPGARVVELGRLRSLDGLPHVLVTSLLPAALVPGLADRDLGGTESLYRVLREEYGLPVVSSVRRVEAAVADARQAHLLRIRRGDPLLVLRSTAYTTGHRPVEWFVASHRGDRIVFEVEVGSVTNAPARPEPVRPGGRA
ncbi:MAG TPA: GntR family transcriptional regulator [Gaiellaceae bacterium]|nr:GntR family transcriptional regulator [Gaiellaceae bacterium]